MSVYLPTGAVGNGRVLASLGKAGEVMAFFYPHIDFAQNIHQMLPALYIGDPGHGRFLWAFDDAFKVSQEYLRGTNVLVTRLQLDAEQVTMTFTDFCPPDTTAFVRRVEVSSGDQPFRGTVMLYCDLRLSEVTGKQSVWYMYEEGMALQYFRDVAIAIGGERPATWRCGKSIDEGARSARSDMFDGHLSGQPEDIGQVDFALGWHISIEAGESKAFDIIISAGNNREQAVTQGKNLSAQGSTILQAQTTATDAKWLGSLQQPAVSEYWKMAYERSLLSLAMLQDAETGSVIAAPEFDPAYELCGGYGYCWPRDATEAIMALEKAGQPGALEKLCDWYLTAQLPSGHWGQRYWHDGRLASSWSLREDFLQVDQTAAAIIALCERGRQLAECEQTPASVKRLKAYWESVQRGATALAAMVGETGLHDFACDLWETFCGTFIYTNAAIYAALKGASEFARQLDEMQLSVDWQAVCARMKAASIALHNGEYFARGMHSHGEPDWVVDSSTLGISEPFGMLSPHIPHERELIVSNLKMIEQRLNWRMQDGGVGIRRYEGDGYLGGVIGCVNTLWYALVCLQVANTIKHEDAVQTKQLVGIAECYMEFAMRHTTPTGLLPELIGTFPEYPYWAAPHSWASGLMVKCVLELGQVTEPVSI